MRRSRRRRGKPNRHVSLSATDAEWAVVSGNAERRGLSKARYLMGLVERDAPGSGAGAGGGADPAPPMALAPDEQRALLASVRAIHALLTEDAPAREERPPEEEIAPPAPEDATPPPADAPSPPENVSSPDTAHPPPRQGRLF